jgi:AraC-like DNA-binding protein
MVLFQEVTEMTSSLEFIYRTKIGVETDVFFHTHNCHELVYYISGSGYTCIDNINYKYLPNTFTITQAGFSHNEVHLENTDVIYIGFNCRDNEMNFSNGLYEDSLPSKILLLMEEIKDEMLSKKLYREKKMDLLLQILMLEFQRVNSRERESGDPIIYLRKYIMENFHQDISVKDLASQSGYSYHHFRRIFKQHAGLSPVNYLINIRVENAKKLLESSQHKMSTIAQSCGFSTSSQFCSMFKEYTGLTPAEYRRSRNDIFSSSK